MFKVYFPESERQISDVGTKVQEALPGGVETVLVAEDEGPVRAVVARVLSGAGYRVLQARDGVEAVAVFTAHADEVDLVVMDAIMPRRGGAEAVANIRALQPDIKIVISSGYTGDTGEGFAGPDDDFLAKPYDPELLLRTVRRALDRPREQRAG